MPVVICARRSRAVGLDELDLFGIAGGIMSRWSIRRSVAYSTGGGKPASHQAFQNAANGR
jgi:hypothetical protein